MKSEIERQISHNITYMWNLKEDDTNELIYKTETDLDKENKLVTARGRGLWKGGVNIWISRCKLLYRERINNKVILHKHRELY